MMGGRGMMPGMGMQPSIILLEEGTDTSQGKAQLISNINACAAVADIVRTTLGPRGMDKLIHNNGKVRGQPQPRGRGARAVVRLGARGSARTGAVHGAAPGAGAGGSRQAHAAASRRPGVFRARVPVHARPLPVQGSVGALQEANRRWRLARCADDHGAHPLPVTPGRDLERRCHHHEDA